MPQTLSFNESFTFADGAKAFPPPSFHSLRVEQFDANTTSESFSLSVSRIWQLCAFGACQDLL